MAKSRRLGFKTVALLIVLVPLIFITIVGLPMIFAGALCSSLGVQTLGFWQVFWIQALLGAAGAAWTRNVVRTTIDGAKVLAK